MQEKDNKKEISEEINIENLKKELEDCRRQKEEYLTGWQKARADFLNHKKEEMERISQIIGYANEELIIKILPILDNFEVAEKKLPENLKTDENIKGLLLIKSQILDFLKSLGVEEIRTVGEIFNPELHEVTEEVEPSVVLPLKRDGTMEGKEIKSGMIIEEIQKGYKINERLLRPARVKVTK